MHSPPNPQNIPAEVGRTACPPVQGGKEAQTGRQQLAQGHVEKRAEQGQKGPASVNLHYPVQLPTSRSSELFTISSFLKEDNGIVTGF